MDNNRPDPPPIVIVPADRDRARWLELKALQKVLAGPHGGRPSGLEREVRRLARVHRCAPQLRWIRWCGSEPPAVARSIGIGRVCVGPGVAQNAACRSRLGVTARRRVVHGTAGRARSQFDATKSAMTAAGARSRGRRTALDDGLACTRRRSRWIPGRRAAGQALVIASADDRRRSCSEAPGAVVRTGTGRDRRRGRADLRLAGQRRQE